MSASIVAIDTETTSLRYDRQVWDIAMIRRDEHGEKVCQVFVDVDIDDADPFSLRIGGYYQRHPQGLAYATQGIALEADEDRHDYVTPVEAARIVARWTHGAHLVGAVPNFDAEALDRLLRLHGLLPAWHHHLIDVEALAVGYLHGLAHGLPKGEQQWETVALPWKSDDLSRACGVEPPGEDERHTALGDARWALRWFDAITGGAR